MTPKMKSDISGPYRAGDDDENTVCQYCGERGFHADDCLYINAATAYDHVCVYCGKSDWDFSTGCLNPFQYTPSVGDWACGNYLGLSK